MSHPVSVIRKQNGATAVEFALVLPVFFVLFYAILSFGMSFLVRLGLQHAAEAGARAALLHQHFTYPPLISQLERQQLQLEARRVHAEAVASQQASWMNNWGTLSVSARICPTGVDCTSYAGTFSCEIKMGTTGAEIGSNCQIVVTVISNYAEKPPIPPLPGLSFIVPTILKGQAGLLLDGRAVAI